MKSHCFPLAKKGGKLFFCFWHPAKPPIYGSDTPLFDASNMSMNPLDLVGETIERRFAPSTRFDAFWNPFVTSERFAASALSPP